MCKCLLACVHVHHVHAWYPQRSKFHKLCNWRHWWLWTTVWVLGTTPRPSASQQGSKCTPFRFNFLYINLCVCFPLGSWNPEIKLRLSGLAFGEHLNLPVLLAGPMSAVLFSFKELWWGERECTEDKTECQIPWRWNYRGCESPQVGVGNWICPLREQQRLLPPRLSLQPH